MVVVVAPDARGDGVVGATSAQKHWHIFSYDIRDQKRWRRVYRTLNGYGERLQYSVFRCNLTNTQMEAVRHELEMILDDADDLLIIRLAPRSKVFERAGKQVWEDTPPPFDVF